MKTVRNACKLQPNALEINVGNQVEKLDVDIQETDGREYFKKTFVTEGMQVLLTKGMARLSGKSSDSIFHLKQAMGGGKTHIMKGFGLLAKNLSLRGAVVGYIPYQDAFGTAKVAAFNGRNNPANYFWGYIAAQLGKEALFKEYWDSGAKAPDEEAWLKLFEGSDPILILLDEMPPYFQYYSTQTLGHGTVADVVTRAFSNMLTAAQKRDNVCIVVSDLEAAYDTGGKLIQSALDDATQELGRAEVSITPVNLESNEIYEILRKRLFESLPSANEIAEIASVYAKRLSEAARAKTVERSAEALASDIEATYPFHPSFKSLVALFKENEKFKQTRGLMELVSRLLKSVWESEEEVYLIGAQHFDLSIHEVREKLADISEMRDVMARDLWDSQYNAHAQIIDINNGNDYAKQVGTLLLTASLSTAVNSVRGLTESELLECLIDPIRQGSDYRNAFEELQKSAWYMHQSQEGRHYFSRQENLTKKLQGYAEKAPLNKVEELIRLSLKEMYDPITKEAYAEVLPLPDMEEADAVLKRHRALLIISPDGKTPPHVVERFYQNLANKNNLLILTGDKSSIASVESAARHVYAVTKADNEITASHPQRKELDEKKAQYQQDFFTTVLNVFDKVIFPRFEGGRDVLSSKALDSTYSSSEPYKGEVQIVKTLVSDPLKLYLEISPNFDGLKERVESYLFGNMEEMRKVELLDRMKQNTRMPWLPTRSVDQLFNEAFQRGVWEDLGNGYITRKPKPKTTHVQVSGDLTPDDNGKVILKVDAVNAGNNPRIYYEEDGVVTQNSKVLQDNKLETNALKVQFLAVDPTDNSITGDPVTWKNKLVIRNYFDDVSRTVELFVAPKGRIKYTLDGSEPRNGELYTGAIQLTDDETTIYVFAECEDLESKTQFIFPASDSEEVPIVPTKAATLNTNGRLKVLDSTAKTYDGLKLAREKGIEFENVTLQISSPSQQQVALNIYEIKVTAGFIEDQLNKLVSLIEGDKTVIMKFKKAYVPFGSDLEIFVKTLGIEVNIGEIEQSE